ncbi:MAG TPA: rod shape-determining protein MreC [Usitatibacter sp.]|jgi:rod shape-determining protein MreC|nr:rod shape-determining protein MreC [Usitatibacter sp.]
MIREPPPFFHRGPSPLARLTFFTLFAVGLMIADHRFHALETVRLSLTVLTQPVQQVSAMPAAAVARVADYFASQDRLLRENQELKAKVLEQSAAAQEAKLLKAEQEHLLAMSPGQSRYANGGLVAEVLYTARNPFTRKIIVDKGLTQGVKSGMPVIDGSGVVGQVTNVGTFTSEVTLVTEKDQSVPVMLVRNGLRAVAVGSGKDGSIDVPFMPVSADIQNGDMFVTSGIDGTYPPGLVVAQVTSVEKNAAYVFAKIVARPAAGVENHRYVMVLPVPTAGPPRPEAKTGEEKRGRERNPRGRR